MGADVRGAEVAAADDGDAAMSGPMEPPKFWPAGKVRR